ncbi:MAG: hypothetical protein IJA20_10765 [Methanocorpusculum sp.]|nr:hypothetical protein [Methanocorpusculum sp.]
MNRCNSSGIKVISDSGDDKMPFVYPAAGITKNAKRISTTRNNRRRIL